MKSIRRAHIVVVADSDCGVKISARLRRMEVARVTNASLEEARRLCQAGGVDACIVALDDSVPDAMTISESDAPGRSSGVPSLVVAPVMTPNLRKAARRCGYLAAISSMAAPRMFYRRIGAALQQQRASSRNVRWSSGGIGVPVSRPQSLEVSGPTLH